MHGSIPANWHWVALVTLMVWAVVFRVRLSWRQHLAGCLALAWVAALFTWSVRLDAAVGSASGRVVSARSHQPLVGARVYDPDEERWVRTDADGAFRLNSLPVRKKVRLSVRAGGYEASYEEVKIEEGKETGGILFRMTPRTPTFNIYNYQRVFTPQETPKVHLIGVQLTNVDVAVFRLDPRADHARVMSAEARARLATQLPGEAQAVFETRFTGVLTPDGDFNDELELDRFQPGLYFIRAQATGGSLIRNAWFLVTDLAVVTRRSPHEVLAYAQSFSSGRPLPNTALEFYDGDRVVKKAVTGADGTFHWAEQSAAAFTVLARNGPQYAYSRLDRLYDGDGAQRYKIYVYTERPIYRPGHEVHVRGIVREDKDRVYSIPAGGAVLVTLYDPQGAALATRSVPLSDFGGFETTFALPRDARLGDCSVAADFDRASSRAYFKVDEYRKPEFKVDVSAEKDHYISGERVRVKVDARYFFGSPVTPATVKYSVFESYYHFDRVQYFNLDNDGAAPEHYGGMTAEGTLHLADDGTAWIEFVPDRSNHDRDYWIDVEVEDASHRAVNASTDVLVTLGDYHLDGTTDRWGYQPGEAVSIDVSAREYQGDRPRPNTPVHGGLSLVDYVEKTENGESHMERRDRLVWSKDGVTDSKGGLHWTVTPPSDGAYELALTSQDARGNTIAQSLWFFVCGGERSTRVYGGRDLTVLLDKPRYATNSQAHVLVTSRQKDAWILLSVDGRRIHHYQVVQLHGNSATVTLPVKAEYFPNVIVSALAIHDKQLLSDERPLVVDTDEHGLDIKIVPDKSTYEPAQPVHCRIRITDKHGHPVRAEFSLGVVDSAIYSLAADTTQKIFDFFYGEESSMVRTEFSFAPDYSGGRDKEDDPRVRRNFKDTAFWAPMLRTGTDGTAKVSFTLPDNLTAWRFTVRAISKDNRVGEATCEVTSRKPLLVRLEVPRFIVERDKMELSAVVHNETEKTQNVEVRMVASGGVSLSGGPQTFSMPPHTVHRFPWNIEAQHAGEAKVMVSAKGQGAGDAMELTFPVLPHSVPQLQTSAGDASQPDGRGGQSPPLRDGRGGQSPPLRDGRGGQSPPLRDGRGGQSPPLRDGRGGQSPPLGATWSPTVPPQSDPSDSRLTVYLSPSLASAAMQGLEYLAAYPYGCVEQTMSAFLPDIVVSRALRELHLPNSRLQHELPDMVSKGLDRLYDMQHADGGWGWWRDDTTQPYLTAYVVAGLYEAKRAGYDVRDDAYKRGVAALKKLTASDSSEFMEASGDVVQQTMWNVRAYELNVLCTIGADVRSDALDAERHVDELNPYTQALLAATLWRVGEQEKARALLQKIRAAADETTTTCHWDTKTVTYSWVDDPVEATASVLRAMLLIDPSSPQVDKTVRWLIAYRKGESWDSTKDTAAVIDVLTDVLLARRGELSARYEAVVRVNGTAVAHVPVDGPLLGEAGVVKVPSNLLREGTNRVEIGRTGQGTLYWSARLETFSRQENFPGEDKGLSITRSYALISTEKDASGKASLEVHPLAPGAPVPIGAHVRVTVNVKNTRPYPYVLIEDKLIPGCELTEEEANRNIARSSWWVGREVHDDRLSVFITRLEPGEHQLVYEVRAEAAGQYHVRPAEAYLMYTPEVRGYSPESSFTVSAQEAPP